MLTKGRSWSQNPWELVATENLQKTDATLAKELGGKSEKFFWGIPLSVQKSSRDSATELAEAKGHSFDLVITDPPFGGLIHYSELSDFFYVWLRLVCKRDILIHSGRG